MQIKFKTNNQGIKIAIPPTRAAAAAGNPQHLKFITRVAGAPPVGFTLMGAIERGALQHFNLAEQLRRLQPISSEDFDKLMSIIINRSLNCIRRPCWAFDGENVSGRRNCIFNLC